MLRWFVRFVFLGLAASWAAAPGWAAPGVGLSGYVVTADGGAVEGLEVRVRAGRLRDVAPIDSTGRFFYLLPRPAAGDSVELVVDAVDAARRRYHPALLRLGRAGLGQEQRIVLIPSRWTVAAGRHGGTSVEISLHRAFAPTCRGCGSFYRRGSLLADGGASRVPAWPDDVFPLRVAFDRARSEQRVTARDSAAFWQIAHQMEADFGRALFRPARYSETLPADDDGPADVILIWIVPTLRYSGRGAVGFLHDQIISGALWIQSTALLLRPGAQALVTHELMHTLGFGHTCGWRSAVADAAHCPWLRSPTLTAEDVAYFELARHATAVARASHAQWGIEAALAGEQTLVLGLALDHPR